MNKVFLTGHKGYLGSYIFNELSRDYKVIGFDLKDGQDIQDYGQLLEAMKGCKYVVHGAGIPHPNPEYTFGDYFNTNVIGSLKVLRAALEIEAYRFIYLSSGAYYGWDAEGKFPAMKPLYFPIDELHPPVTATMRFNGRLDSYCQSKVIVEQLLAWYGTNHFQTIALRLAPASTKEIYLGNCAAYFNNDCKGKKPLGIEVHLRTFWTYVKPETVAWAARAAIEIKGDLRYEAFNITEPQSALNLDYAKYLKFFPDVPFRKKWTPPNSLLDLTKAREKLGFGLYNS